MGKVRVGTAGWSIASRNAGCFPGKGTQLERYAARLDAVEINSSFYRPHRVETYRRWAASVPDRFRFSVKMPKTITHERRLVDCGGMLAAFLGEVSGLGAKLGVVLVQLPPSLPFDPRAAEPFLRLLRGETDVAVACEPRHKSWFAPEVGTLLDELKIARVAADPVLRGGRGEPGGWPGLVYRRLHGSPHIYRSDYPTSRLAKMAETLAMDRAGGAQAWCIFDNTAEGHALGNALMVMEAVAAGGG
jgi:uncharacterized protein YecE (DUF72 family)